MLNLRLSLPWRLTLPMRLTLPQRLPFNIRLLLPLILPLLRLPLSETTSPCNIEPPLTSTICTTLWMVHLKKKYLYTSRFSVLSLWKKIFNILALIFIVEFMPQRKAMCLISLFLGGKTVIINELFLWIICTKMKSSNQLKYTAFHCLMLYTSQVKNIIEYPFNHMVFNKVINY